MRKIWTRALTFIEFVVVLGVVAVLGITLLPAMARTIAGSARITCADNLKQIGLAFNTWAADQSGRYPMAVSSSQGGPYQQTAYATAGAYFGAMVMCQVFSTMSNELVTPKILVCPSDSRIAHTNFTVATNGMSVPAGVALDNSKISYWLGKDATSSNPRMLLCGDRNIDVGLSDSYPGGSIVTWTATSTTSGVNAGYGATGTNWYALSTNGTVANPVVPGWTPAVMHQGQGDVLLVDGSVQQLNSAELRQVLTNSGDTTATPGRNTCLFP
jgi:hypothetical protein